MFGIEHVFTHKVDRGSGRPAFRGKEDVNPEVGYFFAKDLLRYPEEAGDLIDTLTKSLVSRTGARQICHDVL